MRIGGGEYKPAIKMGFACRVADRVVFMDKGQIVETAMRLINIEQNGERDVSR